jgi:hypothetical protein
MQRLIPSLADARPQLNALQAAKPEAPAARAEDLGVRARIAVDGTPFVLAWTVDGRGFYL